jgi:xanthine dehydrogenase YagT iron-sulfur-binding subunit
VSRQAAHEPHDEEEIRMSRDNHEQLEVGAATSRPGANERSDSPYGGAVVPDDRVTDLSRREFLQVAAAGSLGGGGAAALSSPSAEGARPTPSEPNATGPLTLEINDRRHQLEWDPRVTLLDTLRARLGLTGTKKGCDHGQCGACTVLVEGRRIYACLTLTVMHAGARITTIEGLAEGEELHPLQEAFIRHDAFQCGYCTPGQICSAVGLMNERHAHTDDDVREQMSGNLCRCGAYPNIVAAIRDAQAASNQHR